MHHPILLILFLLSFNLTFAQKGKVIQEKATLFQLEGDTDTIEFIVVDTILDKKKPIFLWCQGSLPQPLFGEMLGRENEWKYYFQGGGIANFDYAKIVEDYHLVVISMPHTPVVVSRANLNQQFLYVPDPNKPSALSEQFIEADYLDNYVSRGNKVLEFLATKDWVETSGLIVAGMSQGSKVATKIAVNNPMVTHLGLFSPNPFGRVDQFIRQARLDAQLGKISWEKADTLMQLQYDYFKIAHNPDSLKAYPRLEGWKSFSEPLYDDWLSLDIPIYLAYGTEDRTSDLCDIVPLFFISVNKSNLTLKRYLHLEHNFFEVGENGRPNYEKANWDKVMLGFVEWINHVANKL
ncbi:hypothetical protein [Persicobacter psychrovividus]|uniref:Alpha/beta hydrolase n=1 Tax=Persicobacter psychrovividus TaxID=387638 RepID=A0ABM7VEQ9_9BACT|nr:hypothetical protein PEPS_17570 [Persicobacter psychrovividus]